MDRKGVAWILIMVFSASFLLETIFDFNLLSVQKLYFLLISLLAKPENFQN